MPMMLVSIDGIRWHGSRAGVGVNTLREIKDWFAPATAEQQRAVRSGAPGSLGGARHVGEKSLTLTGFSVVRTQRDGDMLAARLGALVDGMHVISVQTEAGETQRVVSVERVDIPDAHGIPRLHHTIDMVAADPRRYAAPVTLSGGSVQAYNVGTAPTSPVIRVVGAASGPVVVTEEPTGRVVHYSGGLAAGETLVLDPAVGYAVVNGVPRLRLPRAQWPIIPGGESRTFRSSGGSLSVEHRSAWW